MAPNYLLIVADDLGFSDVGAFGGEISTPNLDKLAFSQSGIRFTQFYAAAACSPTRSMLMTGTDNHIAGVGQMFEFVRQNKLFQEREGYEGHLNDRVATLPEQLVDAGYETIMSGKWHLGLTPETSPWAKGFQKSFSLLPGACNHYGWEPAMETFSDKPSFMQSTEAALHAENGKYLSKVPDDFYSTDFYASKMIDYLQSRDKSKPFFAYLPFTAPHWPLQAPREIIEKYKGFYDEGPAVLREKRLKRLIELGLVEKDVKPHDINEPEESAWENLTDEQRAKSARAMEVYAAMVERMDWNIGKVLEELKNQGVDDDTVIIFMSDNGAEGASMEARPVLAGLSIEEYLRRYFDNSLENIGNKNSYAWYGPRWAQAATAPSWLYKTFASEGGIHVPLLLHYPKLKSSQPRITHTFTTVMDILPTFLDLAGAQVHDGHYKGREVAPVRGKSWRKFLEDEKTGTANENKFSVHDTDETIGWELFGHAAVRKGDWKLTFIQKPRGPEKWQLFNLHLDPGETQDLSEEYPAIYEELLQDWEKYKVSSGVVGVGPEWKNVEPVVDELEDDLKWMKYDRVSSGNISREIKQRLIPTSQLQVEN